MQLLIGKSHAARILVFTYATIYVRTVKSAPYYVRTVYSSSYITYAKRKLHRLGVDQLPGYQREPVAHRMRLSTVDVGSEFSSGSIAIDCEYEKMPSGSGVWDR